MNSTKPVVSVVIPCYKVKRHILEVIASIGEEVSLIIAVDDACPEQSGQYIQEHCQDSRVKVIFNAENRGVGGAVMHGYQYAIEQGADIMVKIDGDGQMDPQLLPAFIEPLLIGNADYTKGNRFYNPEDLRKMPAVRLFGNGVLSFMTKFSSGYYSIFDPTNGYTAITASVAKLLPLDKIANRYFFESDILFRLNTINAVVRDIPMQAVYADEESGLKISKILGPFLRGHLANVCKRMGYSYFLRGFSLASLELIIGIAFLLFGSLFGIYHWMASAYSGVAASSGTVMMAALPILSGIQLILSFINFDVAAEPKSALSPILAKISTHPRPHLNHDA